MSAKPTVLICDDDELFQATLKLILEKRFKILVATDADAALGVLSKNKVDAMLLDMRMRSPLEGLGYLPRFFAIDPGLPIIVSSGETDYKIVRDSIKAGACDYIAKGAAPLELISALEKAIGRRRSKTPSSLRNAPEFRVEMIGKSVSILKLKQKLEKIRNSQANVIILGETGTGKEVVARQLQKQGEDGAFEPFVAIDSSTIQSSMAESLLFGHEKGAFTGADQSVRGLFEEADGGVVYFDELANMPLDIQAKLLRVLQEKEIKRLGSHKVIPLQFRVIAATNKDLRVLCQAGQFKEDLFQRLNVLPVEIPPLRERAEDIPLFLEHFAAIHAKHCDPKVFSKEAEELLTTYPWPGNIRELSNLVAFCTTMIDEPIVEAEDLPTIYTSHQAYRPAGSLGQDQDAPGSKSSSPDGLGFYERVALYERSILESELKNAEGNMSKLATKLKMDRSHLYRKLRDHQISKPESKSK